ncbi:hypothetical protein KF947_17795 [Halomonas sp. FeN2]|uniref:hypothetical protein n=1 Tax=Halomonas sp. FeN2 TaxID=2832500 RepID=UPI001D0BE3C6|nr:hypothetical protein [Halomonas sp. FeN2]UBR49175.1 hypothetical protein KF947_17795 [Halomonas sp. FeN2]
MLNNKKMSRRTFVTSASLGSGALICYPINVLGQPRSVYLDIEDYDTINAIRASAKQEFALLCLNPSPDDQIDTSSEVLGVLQNELDRIVPEFVELDDIEGEEWIRTNFSPAPFNEDIPLRDEDDINWILPPSTLNPCAEAVLRILADVFNIEPNRIDDFRGFLSEQNQVAYVDGMADSLEQGDNNKLRNYIELLINDFTISEAIKQAVETLRSPIARAIRLWLMKRTIPFVGLCLAIMDVGISLIRQRHYILECAHSVRN